MKTLASTAAIAALAIGFAIPATGAENQAMIDEAMTAAPDEIAANATVKDWEGNVLREGTNAFTCMPGIPKGPGPMCVDAEWGRLMSALMKKEDYQPEAAGLGYMLAGDMPDGGASNTDPFATASTADNQWVVEGPHLMVIVPDSAALEGIPTDPENGGPYVMWKGTPYAHIMVPTTGK